MALTIIEHQPDFPVVDLTDHNAAFFDLFLQNEQLIAASHPSAEASRLLFQVAHIAATQAKESFRKDTYHAGFTHGFTMYEVISSIVAPNQTSTADTSVLAASRQLTKVLHSEELTTYLNDAYGEFKQEQTNTAEIIERAAAKLQPGLGYYAVMGAAVERRFELDTREYDEMIVQ